MATHTKKHIKNTGVGRELITKEGNEDYAEIIAPKGDLRFEVKLLSNGKTVFAKARTAITRGPNKKRINVGDTVLVQLDGVPSKLEHYHIIHKYSSDDVHRLHKQGELITKVETNESGVVFDGDVVVATDTNQEMDDDFFDKI
jgi:translation initiation factor IF-1